MSVRKSIQSWIRDSLVAGLIAVAPLAVVWIVVDRPTDRPQRSRRIADFVETNQYGNVVRIARFEETLPGGRTHEILELTDNGPLDNTDLYIVPEGHYFAMGDNRDNSQDSRVRTEVGFIPKANLVGRAEVLFYSTNGAARWYQFWKWPVTMRFTRFFQGVS